MNKLAGWLLVLVSIGLGATGCGGGGGGNNGGRNDPPPPSNNADLSNLVTSAAEFDQVFQSSVTSYTGTAAYLAAATTITATTADPNATLQIEGDAAQSGVTSGVFPLSEGSNVLSATVTAADGVTTKTYLVEVTRQPITAFAQQAYVKASNAEAGDRFGVNVSISGDTLAVGAFRENSDADGVNGDQSDNSADSAGAVYIFTRDGAGVWSQHAYLKASNSDAADFFGISVSLSGDTLAVGANLERSAATGIGGDQMDNTAVSAGAVYVFTRDDAGLWSQQAYIKGSNTEADDTFGDKVSVSGDTLVVGVQSEDSGATGIDGDQADNSVSNAGAAYVFSRNSTGTWTQDAYLKPPTNVVNGFFGGAVSAHGNTVAVAATGAGKTFMYSRDGSGAWKLDAELTTTGVNHVALHGDTVAVGAAAANGGAGAAYVFSRDTQGNWGNRMVLNASNSEANDRFGRAIALSEGVVAIGAHQEDGAAAGVNGDATSNAADSSGAIYVFVKDANGSWAQQAYVKASNPDAQDFVSIEPGSIALSGDTLVFGATGEDSASQVIDGDQNDNSADGAGAVYVLQ